MQTRVLIRTGFASFHCTSLITPSVCTMSGWSRDARSEIEIPSTNWRTDGHTSDRQDRHCQTKSERVRDKPGRDFSSTHVCLSNGSVRHHCHTTPRHPEEGEGANLQIFARASFQNSRLGASSAVCKISPAFGVKSPLFHRMIDLRLTGTRQDIPHLVFSIQWLCFACKNRDRGERRGGTFNRGKILSSFEGTQRGHPTSERPLDFARAAGFTRS